MTETNTTQDAQSDQSVQEKPAEDGTGPVVTTSQLLQAGVHFGHQTRRWNPKMKRFLHGDIGGIYIIDLKQTLARIEAAYVFVRNMVAAGGTLLFVGTKKQIQESTARHAKRCGMPYVNERWLGGMLTNIETIFKRVRKMQEYQRMQSSGEFDAMPKKESLSLKRELAKLERNLGGIGQMDTPPEAVFVLDTKTEHIAVTEANKLRIPLIAVVDTNCDPDLVGYVIPGNDDSIRAGDLMCQIMADAVIAGKKYGKIAETAEVLQSAKAQPTTTDGERLEEAPIADAEVQAEPELATSPQEEAAPPSAAAEAQEPVEPSAEEVPDAVLARPQEAASAPAEETQETPEEALREPEQVAAEAPEVKVEAPVVEAEGETPEVPEVKVEASVVGETSEVPEVGVATAEVEAEVGETPEVPEVGVATAKADAVEVEEEPPEAAEVVTAAQTPSPEHVEPPAPDAAQTDTDKADEDPTEAAVAESPQETGGTARRGMFLKSLKEKKPQRRESREAGRRRGSRSD